MPIPTNKGPLKARHNFGYVEAIKKWVAQSFTSSGAAVISVEKTTDTPEFFEDTSFGVGDSPAILDLNTALGRNANNVIVLNDGPGDFTYSISNDGTNWGDEITLKRREVAEYQDISIDSFRITHTGVDSAYRVEAI
jgi:hypothetical protein